MRRLVFVVACLIACLGHGRRVQHVVVDGGSRSQSLLELSTAFTPSTAAAGRFGTARVHPTSPSRPSPVLVSAPIRSRMMAVGQSPSPNAKRTRTRDVTNALHLGWRSVDNTTSDLDQIPTGAHVAEVGATLDKDNEPKEQAAVEATMVDRKDEAVNQENRRNLFGFVFIVVSNILARIAIAFRRRDDEGGSKRFSIDLSLVVCVVLWYTGSYLYSITNKLALNALGGSGGFPITVATVQMGIGVIYSVFLWAAPDARSLPKITFADYKRMLPVALTVALQNASAVFALSAGAVSFAQIVKSSEPAFSALIGTLFYGVGVSRLKWLTLIPVILGVTLGSAVELQFAWAALIAALISNSFSAISRNETQKLMATDGLKERLGSVGNQFAITQINGFFLCLPMMFLAEGHKLGTFVDIVRTNPVVRNNLIYSGLWSYMYSELATIVIKKTGALSQSVLSAVKRTILVICVGFAMGESMGPLKIVGCSIAIGGAFLYSIADKLAVGKATNAAKHPSGQDKPAAF